MEIRIKIPLPDDPAKRALVIAVICSVLLHVVLLASLFTFNSLVTPSYVKRGEPLLVDLAPDKPEEKAPAGNPARPVGPPAEPAPKTPEPPAPKVAEAPPPPKLPPAPRVPPAPRAPAVAKAPPAPKAPAPRPAPEPPKQVAKAEPPPVPRPLEPPAPSPDALTKAPEPAPKAPDPTPTPPDPDPPRGLAAPPAVPPGPAGDRSAPSTQTALARPPQPQAPSIFRQPGGGGGGLQSGRGGVEGDPIPLDTPEPKYQDYFNKIREKIRANWIYPREAGDRGLQGELLLEFHIAKDGRLAYLSLRNSSGAEILDRFAMNAVRLAQPFPPVPDDITKRTLAINGMFRYQIVGASMLNQYLR